MTRAVSLSSSVSDTMGSDGGYTSGEEDDEAGSPNTSSQSSSSSDEHHLDGNPTSPPSTRSIQIWPSEKHQITTNRFATSTDSRGYIPVYEYQLNGHSMLMDSDNGMILLTVIWKALGHGKADVVKLIESQPAIAGMIRKVRGGYLKIQGTWLPFEIARELARRVAWNIRDDLVPFFGPDFPSLCIPPGEPGFGQLTLSAPRGARARRGTKDPKARAAAQAASLAALNNNRVCASAQVAASKDILARLDGSEQPAPAVPLSGVLCSRKEKASGPTRTAKSNPSRSASWNQGPGSGYLPYAYPAVSKAWGTTSHLPASSYPPPPARYARPLAYPPPPPSADMRRYSGLTLPQHRPTSFESVPHDEPQQHPRSMAARPSWMQLYDPQRHFHAFAPPRPTGPSPAVSHAPPTHSVVQFEAATPSMAVYSESSMRGSTTASTPIVPEKRCFYHLEQASFHSNAAEAASNPTQERPFPHSTPAPNTSRTDRPTYLYAGPSGRARISLLDAADWAERGLSVPTSQQA